MSTTARTNPRPKLRERTQGRNCANEPKAETARTNPRPKLRERTQGEIVNDIAGPRPLHWSSPKSRERTQAGRASGSGTKFEFRDLTSRVPETDERSRSGFRWPDLHNWFWNLKLDQRMTTNGHLTTWTGFTNGPNFAFGPEVRSVFGVFAGSWRSSVCGREARERTRDQNCASEPETKTARTNPRPKLRERTRDQNCASEPETKTARTNPGPKVRERTRDQNCANEPGTISSAISPGRGKSPALIGLIRLIGPIGPIGNRRFLKPNHR
jgi:hypothetical protein